MADEGENQEQTRAVAVRVERTPVASAISVMDSAKFEHMTRVALVLVETQMMPESLTHVGKGDNARELPQRVQAARAVRIVELADRWKASPFALMGACSFVHNQLMVEGKVIHGVIDSEIGVNLDYDFGRWDAKKEACIVGDEGEGDALAVRASTTLPGEDRLRFVDGCVGLWKTTGNGSPWRPGAMKRQLRYRGAREWARAFKPSLLIGILADDEIDALVTRQERIEDVTPQRNRKANLAARLPAPKEDPKPGAEEGFHNGHVNGEARAATDKASEKEPAPDVESIVEGHAPAGEPYFLAGDEIDPSGQRPAYQDGEPQGPLGAGALPIYAEHAARPTKVAAEPDAAGATDASAGSGVGTGAGTSMATGPDTSGGAEDEQGGAETQSQLFSDASQASTNEKLDDLLAFINVTAPNAKTWAEVKGALSALLKTQAWGDAEPHEQRGCRIAAWNAPARPRDKTDPGQDPTAFRCWLEVADDEDSVTGTLQVLEAAAAWQRLTPKQHEALKEAAAATVTRIRNA